MENVQIVSTGHPRAKFNDSGKIIDLMENTTIEIGQLSELEFISTYGKDPKVKILGPAKLYVKEILESTIKDKTKEFCKVVNIVKF